MEKDVDILFIPLKIVNFVYIIKKQSSNGYKNYDEKSNRLYYLCHWSFSSDDR